MRLMAGLSPHSLLYWGMTNDSVTWSMLSKATAVKTSESRITWNVLKGIVSSRPRMVWDFVSW